MVKRESRGISTGVIIAVVVAVTVVTVVTSVGLYLLLGRPAGGPGEGTTTPTTTPPTTTPTPTSIPFITPEPGEYLRGGENKILLIDSRLKLVFLGSDDIDSTLAAVGDLGIEISGVIKNEHDKDWVTMGARAFDSEGNEIGHSVDPSFLVGFGLVPFHVESGQTGDFELHLKYREDIERIELYVAYVTEIPPP